MPDGNTLSVKVSARVRKRLDRLASASGRSTDSMAAEAVAAFVADHARQIGEIERALADSRSPTAKFVPHDEAMRWLASLGTDRPLPMPKGKRRSQL